MLLARALMGIMTGTTTSATQNTLAADVAPPPQSQLLHRDSFPCRELASVCSLQSLLTRALIRQEQQVSVCLKCSSEVLHSLGVCSWVAGHPKPKSCF